MSRPIYVEITIRGSLDELWRRTQTPELHERWDLRFTHIEYLPKLDGGPQRFLYETRLGFGLKIAGHGESVGERSVNGQPSSALQFWSDDFKSLIIRGSGYWKYVRMEGGAIQFLTLYDYQTRWGFVGKLIDSAVFRPLIGWATAWSFDRLRLWIERDIDPTLSALRAASDAFSRLSLAFIWIYQGAIPKLLLQDRREIELAREALPSLPINASAFVLFAGCAEIVLGLLYLVFWRRRSIYAVGACALFAVTLPALFTSPRLFTEAFNPTTLCVAMFALSLIGWVACRDLPRTGRCSRAKPEGIS
ncbi:MAG: DoxX-like family protein [Phycisphaeraceae bacterium]|nr:DoxX-like family protein [Phycisphaeraceae bacterium]